MASVGRYPWREKTSVEQSKEDQKDARVGNLDAAFETWRVTKPVEEQPEISTESEDEVEKERDSASSRRFRSSSK